MKTAIYIVTANLSAGFITMTKDIVDSLLALNTKNRNKRPTIVDSYRRAMDGNMWVPTNQGIGTSASGFLVDGQHRLEALQAAGYPPVMMLLVTGLPDTAMAAVDSGTNRTARDYMQFMFDTNVSAFVSAILRTSMLAADDFGPVKYQPQEYARALEKLGDSITAVMTLEHIRKIPAAVAAALVDAHHKGYQEEVVAFTRALATGEMLERENPALVLRNWIASNKGSGGTSTLVERYKKTTRALQAWIDQRPLIKLYRTKAPLVTAKERGAASRIAA